MKRVVAFIGLMAIAALAAAQPYGNEWIDYDRRHYKIPIHEDGVYRISFNDMANAGIPVSAIDPDAFRMYAFSREIPLYVHGSEDGVFNSTDYIEFVGERNDGRLETGLYESPDDRPNPEYSLYNDTLNHYLTWGGTGEPLRYAPESGADPADYTPVDYVKGRSEIYYSQTYYQGELDASGISNPFYSRGEGWMSHRFGFPGGSPIFETEVATPQVYDGGNAPPARASVVTAGVSNAYAGSGHNHHLLVKYGAEQSIAVNHQFSGYQVHRFDFDLPTSALGQPTTPIRCEVSNSLGVASDYQAVAGVTIEYPRTTDLAQELELSFIYVHNPLQNVTRFDFTEVGGSSPVVYTRGSTPQRIELEAVDGLHRGLISNSFGDEEFECILVSEEAVRPIPGISPAANDGYFTRFDLAGVDSAFLILTHKSLLAAAEQYKNYRQQRFNTVVVTVDELYDQFGGGVNKSSLAIRNFADYLIHTWPTPPRYLLLLGKSVRHAPEGNQAGSRRNVEFYRRNLVPTMGYPPSDLLLTAGLNNTTLDPAILTGRISARDNPEAQAYLDKLQTFESQPHAAWMKNMMHFGGGNDGEQQFRFASYLAGYEATAEDSAFGADVHTFLKNTSEPIQINASQQVEDLINGGSSMMTFFGHASSDGFDQTIDNPENFEWNGKYPFLLGNGCYTGDFHSPGGSTSESYTLIPQKGVIGFLSSVKLGFESSLNDYSRRFYKYLCLDNYGGTVAEHMRETVRDILSEFSPENLFVVTTCIGISLQGDPAVVVNSFPKPDLTVSAQDVYFTPDNITAQTDSVDVNIVVTNTGKATGQSFAVTMEHLTPEGVGDSLYAATVPGLFFRDTVRFRLPIGKPSDLGVHRFNVSVDLPENTVEEMDGFEVVNNQVTGKELPVTFGGIVPVYPEPYAVVPGPQVTVKASTGDPLAEEATYRLQLDTTDTFDSPYLQSTDIAQTGGVVEWTPATDLGDSTVYYWRTAALDQDTLWRESSFQIIGGQSGWGQSHIFQFENNSFLSTEFNRNQRRVDYFTGTVRLTNNVLGNNLGYGNEILLNTDVVEYGACLGTPSLHLAVIEPVSFAAWGTNYGGQNPDHDFGNANANGGCRPRVEKYFIFRQTNPDQMQALANLLASETIPDGHYVVLYSMRYVSYDHWDQTPDLYGAVQGLGASMIGSAGARDSVPISLIVRKGDPNFVYEMVGDSINSVLNNVVDIPASGQIGGMVSTQIGPASAWHSLSWLTAPEESSPGDSGYVRVLGRSPAGVETVLFDGEYPLGAHELDNLESQLSAAEFPRLRFEIHSEDSEHATPQQVRRWHAMYDKVPELAVNPAKHFAFQSDRLREGQSGMISVAIENISEVDADSLSVSYYLEDGNRNRVELPYARQDSLRAGQTLIDTVHFDTRGLGGRNVLWVEVNPEVEPGIPDQPEHTRFNNYLQVPLEVVVDEENPALDVTFDGVHILNGEVVSPTPIITVSLKDENPFLLMDSPADTGLFRVFLAEPDGELKRMYFSSSDPTYTMDFVPATDAENRAQVIYRPDLERDGSYRLRVQAGDVSGNPSANTEDYQIDFEVINRSTITEVLNYPNPFTTSTQFVFTLTGREVPDQFKIQIMTVSGRVVREITSAEFGPIRIGRNRSAYRWDGRDEFGDRLANGVYLYRVFARVNGQSIELRDGGASDYFHKGFGKMVLLR